MSEECKTHPCAPHGYDRSSSHSENRYVCECEWWDPDETCAALELQAEIDRLKARAPTWQDIGTAPKDGTLILVANTDLAAQNPTVIYWEVGSELFDIVPHWRTSTHEVFDSEVTHWMLPPEPPQSGENS